MPWYKLILIIRFIKGINEKTDFSIEKCSSENGRRIYRTCFLLSSLGNFVIPPLGTLLFHFSNLLHPYFQSQEAQFGILLPVAYEDKYQKLNDLLSKFFFVFMTSLVQQTSDKNQNISIPSISLFDVPHLLTPSLPVMSSPFFIFGDFQTLCDDYFLSYFYLWQNYYDKPESNPRPCQNDGNQANIFNHLKLNLKKIGTKKMKRMVISSNDR